MVNKFMCVTSQFIHDPDTDVVMLPMYISLVVLLLYYFTTAEFNKNDTSSTGEVTQQGANAFVADDGLIIDSSYALRRQLLPLKTQDHFKDFLTHPFVIDHRLWTSATASVIATSDLITEWFSDIALTPLFQKANHFTLLKAEIVLRIVVQGQPFAAGKVIAACYPNPRFPGPVSCPTIAVAHQLSRINAFIVPHVEIDPSQCATYELRLPIATPTGVYAGNNAIIAAGSTFGSWNLEFVVINPLFSGTATAASMTMCTYMHFENPVWEGLTLLSGDFVEEKKVGGTISTFLKQASGGASAIAPSVGILSPYVSLFSSVTGTIGDVLSWFGFSKPPAVENVPTIFGRYGDNYSQFEGRSIAPVLAGSSKTSTSISTSYGAAKMQDMDLHHLASIPGLVSVTSISQATAAGTNVLSQHVNPMLGLSENIGDFGVTPLCGVTAPFRYWCGDFLVDIEVVASVFHRATLLFAWDPRPNAVTPTFTDVVTTLKHETLFVSGCSKTTIRIPWLALESYKLNSGTILNGAAYNNNNSIGRFYIYVVNPVTANGSTDGIQVNVFYYTDNMSWHAPDPVLLSGQDTSTDMGWDAVLLASNIIEFGPKSNLSLNSLRSFGEEYHSVKQLTSKLLAVWQFNYSITAGNTAETFSAISFPNVPWNFPGNATVAANNAYFRHFYAWYGPAYLGYRGGMRWSYHAMEPRDTAMKNHYWVYRFLTQMTTSTADMLSNSFGTTATHSPLDAAKSYAFAPGNRLMTPLVDAVLPSESPFDFYPTRQVVSTWYDNFTAACHTGSRGVADWTNTNILLGATADDGVFLMFLGFPMLHRA